MEIRTLVPEEYPGALREIPRPPKKLWLRGTLAPEGTKSLVVVGSRALSPYGRDACRYLIEGLAGYPISIVSGLALGADACAHDTALKAGLHTLAVPGSGLDDSVIYPATNRPLAKRILESGGGLLSEQEPLHKPYLKEFPSRNRLMVGLADAVLLIEAAEKSGTLITARLAGEYSRDLLVVPHRIGDTHGFGAHVFSRLGAGVVTEPAHILEALGVPTKHKRATMDELASLNPAEQKLWNMLEEPKTRDELLRAGTTGAQELLTALISLELRGLVREEFGAWHRA